MSISGVAILVVLAAMVLYIIAIYNHLVVLKNRYKNSFSQIEVQLKRRYDLIPNLVATAKGYLQHERETLEAVIAARNQAVTGLKQAAINPGDGGAIKRLAHAEQVLNGALGRLSIVVEDYPDLKANQNMIQLGEELTSTENRIAFARQAFNDAVMNYNTYKQSFPQNIFAGLFGHRQDSELLQFEDSQAIQAVPRILF